AVIGRVVRINDVPSTIVGVMPEGFAFPFVQEVWQPLSLFAGIADARRGVRPRSATPAGYGRLADGATVAPADAEVKTIAARLARDYPDTNKNIAARVTSLSEAFIGSGRSFVLTLMGAVVIVLLIACVNVATLLLARAAQRSREIAIRASLGA